MSNLPSGYSEPESLDDYIKRNNEDLEDAYAEIEILKSTIALDRNNLEQIKSAIKSCFPSLTGCDGVLLVRIENYNKLVDVVNRAV